jgi:Domain of unknown function (DUF4037)
MTGMVGFRPGLRLAGEYYTQVVRPLLGPGLRHSAALLGAGSEVLGFDTARSTDHDWGPRLQIFLADGDAGQAAGISAMLAARLPAQFGGYPTAFPRSHEPGRGPRHGVAVAGLGGWLAGQLGFDPRAGVGLLDWLATPTQRLAEVTAGQVFHDGLGELGLARDRLAWYPGDVWRYVLACQWQRIAQEEAFPGRCAEAGDELGSAVVTARLARDLMRLALLMRRRYPPYSKWLGTAFARLPGADRLAAALAAATNSASRVAAAWPDRQRHLALALETAAGWHNELGLTEPLDSRTRPYYDRPYQVLDAGRFGTALLAGVADSRLRRLPLTGACDQFIDGTDALGDVTFLRDAVALSLGRG